MAKRWNIGIDIGGTKTNIGIVSESGRILDKVKIPTGGADRPEQFFDEIYRQTALLLKRNSLNLDMVSFLGCGVPGTVDSRTGMVEYCPNLFWEDVPAGELLGRRFGRQVILEQDVRLAALAEYCFGAGMGYAGILCVAVGTGIGSGILLEGKIYHGYMNTAGEIGHSIFEKNGRPCVCGKRGCLERYASGTGILERALEVIKEEEFGDLPVVCESVFALAEKGNLKALQVIDDCVSDLAVGIANEVSILSPEIVIIAGGLCEAEELFVKPLKKYVDDFGYYPWVRKKMLKIEKAKLGSDAAMIGASVLYRGL